MELALFLVLCSTTDHLFSLYICLKEPYFKFLFKMYCQSFTDFLLPMHSFIPLSTVLMFFFFFLLWI